MPVRFNIIWLNLGPKTCGANFRTLLEGHPPYVDPQSSLAGGYMVNFGSYRKVGWNPDLKPPEELQELRQKYQLVGGIGAAQHFCQDLAIGLELGWGGHYFLAGAGATIPLKRISGVPPSFQPNIRYSCHHAGIQPQCPPAGP